MGKGLLVRVATVGCRLNQAESDCLRGWLQTQGATLSADDTLVPDVYYVNTCAVTANAERRSLAVIRAACRLRPKPRGIVLGCLAARAPALVRAIPGVDQVLSTSAKCKLLSGTVPLPARSRALLKVQDGCDRTCSYCIVRLLRGKPVSVPPEQVLNQFKQLLSSGYQEIVLTGLNLGSYQHGRTDLAGLLAQLLRVPGRFRLRLTSIEPDLWNDELLTLIADPKICAHFHLPLQAGDDPLLQRMNRRYLTSDYARLLRKILAVKPDACLGADLLVGFPGEDESSFERTRRFLDSTPLHYLHIFPYSPRPKTPSYTAGDPIPAGVKQQRVHTLRQWSEKRRRLYAARFFGTVREAVLEPGGKALTDNYLRITYSNRPPNCPPGALVKVLLHNEQNGTITGTILTEQDPLGGEKI